MLAGVAAPKSHPASCCSQYAKELKRHEPSGVLGHESTAPNDSLHVWGEVAPWALQLRVRMLPARLREVWAVYGPMTFAAPVAAGHEARLSSTLALARELDF